MSTNTDRHDRIGYIERTMAKGLLKYIMALVAVVMFATSCYGENAAAGEAQEKEDLDVKEIIFHHLGDGYGWEVPFMHEYRIPLPVIVKAQDGPWFMFSSSRLTEHVTLQKENGETESASETVPYAVEKDGKKYYFLLAHGGSYSGKVIQLMPLEGDALAKAEASEAAKAEGDDAVSVEQEESHDIVFGDNYVYIPAGKWEGVEGGYYSEYRPADFSITKNVLALIICVIVVASMLIALSRHYKRHGFKAPRKGMGFLELGVEFVYFDVIKPTLGVKARKFAPYLLTCFFFILVMNLLGLIVIFPGGANLTGNIAVTLVLAVLTFVMTNIRATKHYWKEILWPDVPIWLKCPIPIMQFIEVFGMFTKPAALCVRLFANMMGGHMIVITLTVLIFIFAAFGAAAVGSVTVLSVLFSIFMLALDVLVSLIQAYVFTMLSTIFIGMAQEEGEHEHAKGEHKAESEEKTEALEGNGAKSSAAPVNV